jgi:cell division protein FtsB
MKWFSGNFTEFKDITSTFCKMYGLDPEAQKAPGSLSMWQKAFDEFQRSFGELAIMMDLVPRKEYIALSRENQDLKKRIAELEEGMVHQRALLAEKAIASGEGLKGFQELISEQAKHYQDFMKNIGNVFETNPSSPEARPEPAAAKPKPAAAEPKKAKPKAKVATNTAAKATKKK